MSGLLGLLDLGANAYMAQSAGVATSGRNIANVGTEGYSREKIDLRSELGAPLVGGVRALGPNRVEDGFLSSRERAVASNLGFADSFASAALDAEARLTPPGAPDFVDWIARLFSSSAALASAPLDDALRNQAVSASESLAAEIRRTAQTITDAQAGADIRVKSLAEKATSLAAEVAEANKALLVEGDPILADRRDLAAKKLAELTGGVARIDPDGMMRITIDGGLVVVDGERAASFTTTADPALGNRLRIDVVDGGRADDVTARIGGRIGGEVAFRDVTMGQAMTDLDQLAFDLAGGVNAVFSANAGLDGVTGRNLFVPPATVAGAATNFAVESAIVADPRRFATAAPGAPTGDNTGALAFAALADQQLAGGGARTFVGEAIRMMTAVGVETGRALATRDLQLTEQDVVAAQRDSLSGVSIEQELSMLSQFQRSADAATRFIATVDDMLRNLIDRL